MKEPSNSDPSRKLLLVYRDNNLAESIGEFLARTDWNIDVARGVEEAIEKVENDRYDLCVVSNRLRDASDPHDRSEFELIRELKRREQSLQFIINTS